MLFHIRFRNLCLTRINENQKSYDLYHLFSEKHIGYLVDHGKNVRVFSVCHKNPTRRVTTSCRVILRIGLTGIDLPGGNLRYPDSGTSTLPASEHLPELLISPYIGPDTCASI